MPQVNITIDGKPLTVEAGITVMEAASKVGNEIPHYCYHPGLSIAGNCRMCLVEIEKAPKPMIACNTLVAEGMVVKTKTPEVEKMRRSVMEFLLINHPLDCPTCDQAGECRLQDYYMIYDEIPSRFKEEKVHKNKMLDIGAHVMLDQERCVACTRCIRFCKEVGGKDELSLTNRGDHVTITNFPGKPLSNKYAGNVVDICPVGALTNADFRFKKRVWFLKETSSVCPGCSRGCNIEIHHSDSKVYRLLPRENLEVNKYWICDEGRYNYKFINEGRVLKPYLRDGTALNETDWNMALEALEGLIAAFPKDIALVAHAQETNESLEAILAFNRDVLGSPHLYYSAIDPENPTSDDFLINKDKNPNRTGAEKLGFKPLSQLRSAKGLIVVNNLSAKDLAHVEALQIPLFALLASNESEVMKKARVVLPIPTYAEQNGHFTNFQGRVQAISQAFNPKGEALTIGECLTRLRRIFVERAA